MPWDLRPVGPDFFETAPYRFVGTEVLRQPAKRIFEAIAGDPAGWSRWFPAFSSASRYVSPPPHGVGSRRLVRMAGISYDDVVIVWEEPVRWSFRVDRAGAPIAYALAEDYRVAGHGDVSTVQWTFAMDPRAPLRGRTALLDPTLGMLFRRAMRRLERRLSG